MPGGICLTLFPGPDSLTLQFVTSLSPSQSEWILKQEGRLAPEYFSQECKFFDQHLPTVKNETTV